MALTLSSYFLPLSITLVVLAALVILIVLMTSRRRRVRVGMFAVLAAGILAIPGTWLVDKFMSPVRYKLVQYPSFEEIRNSRAQLAMPSSAKNISINWTRHGHLAKFNIERSEFESWFDAYWRRVPDLHIGDPQITPAVAEGEKIDYARARFSETPWKLPSIALVYEGPRTPSGHGFTVWYRESDGTAWQDYHYWQ